MLDAETVGREERHAVLLMDAITDGLPARTGLEPIKEFLYKHFFETRSALEGEGE